LSDVNPATVQYYRNFIEHLLRTEATNKIKHTRKLVQYCKILKTTQYTKL